MASNNKYYLDIQGQRFKLVTQYGIQPYLKLDYIKNPVRMFCHTSKGLIMYDIPNGDYCQGCDRAAEDCPGDRLLICNSLLINKLYGYPIKICVWCKYWIMVRFDKYPLDKVPRVLRDELRSGHTAKNVVARL